MLYKGQIKIHIERRGCFHPSRSRLLRSRLQFLQSSASIINLHKKSILHSQTTMKSLAIATPFLTAGCAMAAETCGVAGYDNSGNDCDPSQPAYNVDTKATTPQLCSALCKSESKC